MESPPFSPDSCGGDFYICAVSNELEGAVQNVITIVVELLLAERDVTVGHHATQSRQAVVSGLIEDYANHGNRSCELTVGKLDVGKLNGCLAVVGTLGFPAHNITTIIAFDSSCQESGS